MKNPKTTIMAYWNAVAAEDEVELGCPFATPDTANLFHFLLLSLNWTMNATNNTVDIEIDVKNPILSN